MSADLPPAVPDALETLIQRCLEGDERAWEAIVRQHWRKVFNIAYKFVGKHDEAEDLTQEIFLKIFKSLETFDRRANFQTDRKSTRLNSSHMSISYAVFCLKKKKKKKKNTIKLVKTL